MTDTNAHLRELLIARRSAAERTLVEAMVLARLQPDDGAEEIKALVDEAVLAVTGLDLRGACVPCLAEWGDEDR